MALPQRATAIKFFEDAPAAAPTPPLPAAAAAMPAVTPGNAAAVGAAIANM